LSTKAIAGLSPDEEPSPQQLAEVAEFVKKNQVQYIFFESLVSPKLSETIAHETGAKTLTFNPLEGLTQDEVAAGQNYLSIQRQNLSALRTALSCQ
jgi:zinc transport system substrate-binding protein